MLENREEELTTVRVQDPRVQNEGSWNSYVDYKIFLHTNSKAFTAKTSCVRRRYREFVWLRRQLQKNAGLVPVPELPGKSAAFFVGSTDEFIEKRRQGLQQFLEKVLQSVVLLSDSRLHLFLQSQLPVPAIEACVQGRGPHGVTEAILRYAMAPCAWGHRGHGPVPAPAPPGHPGDVCAGLGSAQGCLESFPYWGDFGVDEARPESPAGHGVTPLESPDSPAGHGVTPLESPDSPAGHGVTPVESPTGHGVTPLESPARHGVTPLESPESPAGHGVTPLESLAGHGVTPVESPARHGVTPLESPESPAGHRVTPPEPWLGEGSVRRHRDGRTGWTGQHWELFPSGFPLFPAIPRPRFLALLPEEGSGSSGMPWSCFPRWPWLPGRSGSGARGVAVPPGSVSSALPAGIREGWGWNLGPLPAAGAVPGWNFWESRSGSGGFGVPSL
ncbi:sorting nexin-11 isoform X1 [Corvus moneduloides]|uniref:sorting nexin-11 isoform X1 n=1 Tax=Corvus moneduloides TaxID=1196302 RepID=UPI0013633D21|nr:sorting nexin-11 isoform X1 [Corvus moneduloides]XP_031947524.1 sorting nexin-11 isoform X1 [Corvus moneduloides]